MFLQKQYTEIYCIVITFILLTVNQSNILLIDLSNCLKFMALLLFADESTLYLPRNDLTEIQKLVSGELKTLGRWFNSNKLVIDTDKTKYILFHRERENQS